MQPELWQFAALWAVLAFVVGMMAHQRGKRFWLYFGLSLIATPLFGYLMLLLFSQTQRESR